VAYMADSCQAPAGSRVTSYYLVRWLLLLQRIHVANADIAQEGPSPPLWSLVSA
jgi:hypothetical protein